MPALVTGWTGKKVRVTAMSQRGRSCWTISMMEDVRCDAVPPAPKGSEVWYVFQRTERWDDIATNRHPPQLWGTYRAETRPQRASAGYLPAGRCCCMSVEWTGERTLTAPPRNTGPHRGRTELHFTLTDTDGRPCEFWAILLNDDGSPSGCSLKYRAGEVLFDRDTRPVYWKNDSPDLTLVP